MATEMGNGLIARSPTPYRTPMRPLAVLLVSVLVISSILPALGGPEAVEAGSLPTWNEVFHLHDGPDYVSTNYYDWMNTSAPYDPKNTNYENVSPPIDGISIRKNPSPNHKHFWVLDPAVGFNVTITGDMTVHLWARSKGNQSGTIISAMLSDMAPGQFGSPNSWTDIGQATVPLVGPTYSDFNSYDLTIPSGTYLLQAGHALVLTVQRADSLNDQLIVMFDTTSKDSYVSLTASPFITVDSAWAEDPYNGVSTVFPDIEPIRVIANVSDPFGAYDIVGANVSVAYSGNGTILLSPTPLSLNWTDPSMPPYWKVFAGNLPNLPPGVFILNVTATDHSGIPTWFTLSVTVVTVDHFGVSVPAEAVAGEPFTISVTALDSSNATMTNWVGPVLLQSYRPDLVTLGNGTLSISVLNFGVSDAGHVTNSTINYSCGEETVLIRASAGPHFGWSNPIHFRSGEVTTILLNRDSPWTVGAGTSQGIVATGYDLLGNINTSWTPIWTTTGGIGTITGTGTAVTFEATGLGTGSVVCTNALNGVNSTVITSVITGGLNRISLTISPFDPLNIPEAGVCTVLAEGFDSAGNPLALSNVSWDSDTSGTMPPFTAGPSNVFTAGYLPESGAIRARKGNVVGSIMVSIVASSVGPSFSTIPPQYINENSGTYNMSLSGYWHHPQGTSELIWWADSVDTSLFFISHDPQSNSVIQFHPQLNRYGSSAFNLWAADKAGYTARTTVTVNIVHVNQPPHFVNNPPTVLYVKFDLPYVFDFSYYVSDVDNTKDSLVLRSSSPDVYFDGLNGTFMFPHKNGDVSYFEFVTLNVSDGQATAELKIVVWATTDTPPELVQAIPAQTILEGTIDYAAFNLSDYFADPDNDTLFYSYGFHNVLVTIDSQSHMVYLSAPSEWSGTEEGIFMATDPTGALKSCAVSVTVIPVNDPPRLLQDIGTITVKYNLTYYLYLSPYIFDPDNSLDSLTFSIDNKNVTKGRSSSGAVRLEIRFPASLDPNSTVFTDSYTVQVTMTVTDPPPNSTSSSPITFSVRVTGNAPPQVAAPNPDQLYYSFPENSYLNGTLQLYSLFWDPDDVMLTFYISAGERVFARVFTNGDVNLSALVNWSGTEALIVRAFDAHGGWALAQIFVVVTPVNQAPVIYQIPDIINKGSSYRNAHYPIFQYVYDSDDTYSNLTITVTPAGNAFVVGTDLYVSLPNGVNVITVSLQASDGRLSSNVVTFKVGVAKTMAEVIGWPYSFPLLLLGVGITAFFFAGKLPRPYALENLFLIHNDGRLVAHVTREENTTLDKDLVSAMFTAVQEFVRDSFQKGEVGLKKLEIGDKNVVIEKGRSAYLALIYSGWPAKDTFNMLPMLMRDVEERYKERLEKWNGTMKTVKGVERMLQDYMSNKFQPGTWHEEEELAEKEWVDMLSDQT